MNTPSSLSRPNLSLFSFSQSKTKELTRHTREDDKESQYKRYLGQSIQYLVMPSPFIRAMACVDMCRTFLHRCQQSLLPKIVDNLQGPAASLPTTSSRPIVATIHRRAIPPTKMQSSYGNTCLQCLSFGPVLHTPTPAPNYWRWYNILWWTFMGILSLPADTALAIECSHWSNNTAVACSRPPKPLATDVRITLSPPPSPNPPYLKLGQRHRVEQRKSLQVLGVGDRDT